MSLTSELSSKDSWVNLFFKNEFAKLTDFVKREGAAIKALPLKVPLGAHGQAAIVGTAFDYRLRLHFESELERSAVLVAVSIECRWLEADLRGPLILHGPNQRSDC